MFCKTRPVYIQLVLLVATTFSTTVCGETATCENSINGLRTVVQVNENDTDVVIVSTPTSSSLEWSFQIDTGTSTLRSELQTYFNITNNSTTFSVTLIKELDLEGFFTAYNQIVSLVKTIVTCTESSSRTHTTLTILNQAVNEFPPTFKNSPYSVNIREDAHIGQTIFIVNDHVEDPDKPADTGNEYGIESQTQGSKKTTVNKFEIIIATTGDVKLNGTLDYDSMTSGHYFTLKIYVKDNANRMLYNFVTVYVQDVDDQKPTFDNPGFRYEAQTKVNYRGVLDVKPKQIRAYDQDSFNSRIKYTIVPDSDGLHDSFRINEDSGEVTQVKDVTNYASALLIKAQEIGKNNFTETASLLILLGNSTGPQQPQSGKSIAQDDTAPLKTILIVIGVVALAIIVVFIIALVLCHRKLKKAAISPVEDRPSTPVTEEEEILPDTKSETGSKEVLINPLTLPTPLERKGQLPPLQMKDTSTETEVKKKRRRRRKKNKEPEIYDGTREYEKEADPEFFKTNDKQRIKRSTRSKDTKTDPKYWMTVQNENET